MSRMISLAAACAAAAALSGCSSSGKPAPGKDGAGKPSAPASRPASADRGDFKLAFAAPKDDTDRIARRLLTSTGTVKALVDVLNQTLALPHDVAVKFVPGKDPIGPHYDPSVRVIIFPYGFVSFIADVMDRVYPKATPTELAEYVDNASAFIALHELGHALIDQLSLPVLGREEDTADTIATVLLAYAGKDGAVAALSGADLFSAIQEDPSQLDDTSFWDEHSLDAQRSNQTVCLIYGSAPGQYAFLKQYIPRDRIGSCQDEYRQADASLAQVLGPHVK